MIQTRKKIRVINKAIDILKEHKWVRDSEAVDEEGADVRPFSAKAVCFCAYGALVRAQKSDKVSYEEAVYVADDILDDVKSASHVDLISFNDHKASGKRDVIRVLQKTAKHLTAGA